MFVPAMFVVSALASLLFALIGVDSLVDPLPLDRAVLVQHAMLGAGACLLLVLSQTWFALYLLGSGRALCRAAGETAGPAPEWLATATAARRRVLPWCFAVPISALAVFLLGGAVFTGLVAGRSHGLAFGASLLLQVVALGIEGRELRRHERAFARADREAGLGESRLERPRGAC